MEMVGSGLSRKNNLRKRGTRKNEEYFEAVEFVYLAMSELELNVRLLRVVRTLLEIDEVSVSRDLALLGSDKAIEPEAA
jgi:hypothetical protein